MPPKWPCALCTNAHGRENCEVCKTAAGTVLLWPQRGVCAIINNKRFCIAVSATVPQPFWLIWQKGECFMLKMLGALLGCWLLVGAIMIVLLFCVSNGFMGILVLLSIVVCVLLDLGKRNSTVNDTKNMKQYQGKHKMKEQKQKQWAIGGWRHDTNRFAFIGYVYAKDMDEALEKARGMYSSIAYITAASSADD